MIVLGGFFAVLMGMTLSLIGAGGSIMTVPILVYIIGLPATIATAYSLFIVGSTALVGAISYWRRGEIFLAKSLLFAFPALIAVWCTRTVFLPSMPKTILNVSLDHWIMLFFAFLMLIASTLMFRSKNKQQLNSNAAISKSEFIKLIFGSISVGFITGIVGAGGGFLIIPSLVAIFKFTIKQAVGTSLAIIAINSLVGFGGDYTTGISLDWLLLSSFICCTISGIFIGSKISHKLNTQNIKLFFSFFSLLIGIGILIHQLSFILK